MADLIQTLQNSIFSRFGPDKVCLLIIDKLPVEFFLLISVTFYVSLETINRFIHLKGIPSQFCFLYIFYYENPGS